MLIEAMSEEHDIADENQTDKSVDITKIRLKKELSVDVSFN